MTRTRTIILAGTIFGLILASLAGCAGCNSLSFGVPKRTMAQQVALLQPHTDIRIPEGATGPLPTLIMFHGCGGLRDVQENYAAAALEAGYAVAIVDSNGARDIGRMGAMSGVCTALRLWGQERAADVYASLEIARLDPRIDEAQLALIGWSHGGWTLIEALSFSGEGLPPTVLTDLDPSQARLTGVQTAIAVYPYCGFPVRALGDDLDPNIAVRAVLAERDMIADPDDCAVLMDRAIARGRDVEYEIWDGVTHAFDEPNQPPDPRMEYNAEAATRARAAVIGILDDQFRTEG